MLKLIIWDLDDTLWQGTLADGDAVMLVESRAALIRAFNAKGVVSSICSKNDHAAAQAKLEAFGLWDEFVFPHIAFTPKPQAIQAIIADMQLRACDVLFVDDNPLNLAEVRHCIPEIACLDITRPDADAILAAALAAAKSGKSRVADYRILEAKRADRAAAGQLSDTDFLRTSAICACAPTLMDNLDYVDRIAELINRSNQLNYTKSRVTADALRDEIVDVLQYLSFSIFAWDRYGDYGLVGFVMVHKLHPGYRLKHFTFSCRAMHMGLEQYALDKVMATHAAHPGIDAMDLSILDGRFSTEKADWIADQPYDAKVMGRLMAAHVEGLASDPDIRIICNCQSGGLAHYSANRALIEFDNFPRVFTMKQMCEPGFVDPAFPPHVVYGAGVDYANPPWGDLAELLDMGLFEQCVAALCQLWMARGTKALVILPAEDLADHQYHGWMGHSRERTIAYNRIWRRAFETCPCVSIVESQQVHGADEVKDVNHLLPGAARKMARLIDIWYDQVSALPMPGTLAA